MQRSSFSTAFCDKGFSSDVGQIVITNKIIEFNKIKRASVEKCPVYLHLPWLGGINERFAKQLS